MSEEKSYEVEANLEAACGDEECEGCGEVHPAVDLDTILRKQTRWYRATVAAYFASLAATAYCAFELLGFWGAAAFISAFGVYFFHLNMNAMIRMMMTLEQASFGAIMAGKQAEEGEEESGHHGQYL